MNCTPGTFPVRSLIEKQDTSNNNTVLASAIYTSPLSRAVESAALLADEIGFCKEDIQIEPSLIEWHAGCLQGNVMKAFCYASKYAFFICTASRHYVEGYLSVLSGGMGSVEERARSFLCFSGWWRIV